jgi:hypothetical protein
MKCRGDIVQVKTSIGTTDLFTVSTTDTRFNTRFGVELTIHEDIGVTFSVEIQRMTQQHCSFPVGQPRCVLQAVLLTFPMKHHERESRNDVHSFTKTSWIEAERTCEESGSHLPGFSTPDDQRVWDHERDISVATKGQTDGLFLLFLGLHDMEKVSIHLGSFSTRCRELRGWARPAAAIIVYSLRTKFVRNYLIKIIQNMHSLTDTLRAIITNSIL